MASSIQTARRLISAPEVGRKLGIHPRSVFRLADGGRIPYGLKIGAARRWDETALDAWITKGCPPETREAAR